MGLSLLDKALWVAGFLGQLTLLGILCVRKGGARFPFFAAFIAFVTLENVIDFAVYRVGSARAYFWTYWSLGLLEVVVQLGVVYDMAREVLRPAGTWVRDARARFLLSGSLGAISAAALSFAVRPKGSADLYAWTIRLNLFVSLLLAELVLAMFWAAQQLGLHWRSRVMGLGQSIILWVGVSLCVETAHSYWGWTQQYLFFDHLRIAAYDAALGYWCVVFWREEPERKPLSAELMKYLTGLSADLGYNLGSENSNEGPR